MICPECGKEIAENSKFCEYCGTPIVKKPKKVTKTKSLVLFLAGVIVATLGIWAYEADPFGMFGKHEMPFVNSYKGYDTALSERELTESDLYGKSAWKLSIMRNSIYARHGYAFKKGTLYHHFSQYDWYHPTEDDAATIYYQMSNIERHNVRTIKEYEKTLK